MIAAERFKELAEYQVFWAQVDAIHFPVFQSDMTPADFLAMLKTVSNICKKCHDFLQGLPLLTSSNTDESFRALKEHIDRILIICPEKVCVFFYMVQEVEFQSNLERPCATLIELYVHYSSGRTMP